MRQCPPPECCRPASLGLGALHPALAEPNARALICALPGHGATLFGCFSAKCLQPKLALLMVFGLLWLLAYSGLELRFENSGPLIENSLRFTCFTLAQRKDYKMVETRPVGSVWFVWFVVGLFLSFSPPSDCFPFSSKMTWAPCPHGLRTRGKK